MPTFSLKYQTAENMPAPYAHAIEINGVIEQNKDLELNFELTYLDREEFTEEELLEEGFSLNDNFSWKGTLPKIWSDVVFGNLKSANELFIKTLEPHLDFWQVDFEGKTFYPKNTDGFKYLIEELQQAVYEIAGKEAILKLTYLKNQSGENVEVEIMASFVERKLKFTRINLSDSASETKILPWDELNFILKNTFSGEFEADFALSKKPSHKGLFLNAGDELWYEVGKSLLIQPNKILKIVKL
ncbi:hypothetical protein EMA8858_01220 [Emticicia aquatica]|uniref:Uncharacterized protein n=1 Tax=Emticicia aquatica TaxID=1681835 RepID=A0ABM9AMR5_9BACT|nr:hypothetical protein [Emticicia aquatica]CAH0995100.1 hypothetical protein EMA8858_01220 [Emticicia aquatica]